jgi:hypothetical protein
MKYFIINIALYLSILSVTKAQSYNVNNSTDISSVLRIDQSGKQIITFKCQASYLEINDTIIKNAAYYLKKSKHQNSTAFTLAIAGTVFVGAALLAGNAKEKSNSGSWNFGPSDKEIWTGILGIVGGSLIIASIPSFVNSGVNKHKARVALQKQKTGFGIPKVTGDIAGLLLSIPLGKY